jgi:shikimate kinase
MEERSPLYAEVATLTVVTTQRSPEDIASEIELALKAGS